MSVLLIKMWWALMLPGEEAEVEDWMAQRKNRAALSVSPACGSFAAVGWCSHPKAFAGITEDDPTVFNVGTSLSPHSSSDSNCLVLTQGLFCWEGCKQFSTLHFGVLKCMGKDFHYGSLVGWASVFVVNLLQLRKPLGLFSNFLSLDFSTPLSLISSQIFNSMLNPDDH